MQIIFLPFLWSPVSTNPSFYITASLFLPFIVLEEGSIMIHITLYYTEITTCLYEKEEDIMVANIMIDGDGFQDLEKFRIGESVWKKRIEDSNWPASKIVEIIVSCWQETFHFVYVGQCIVLFGSYLSYEIRECVETSDARCFTVKHIDFSVFTGETRQNYFSFVNTYFSENNCFEGVHYLVCNTWILLSFIVIFVPKIPLPGLPK